MKLFTLPEMNSKDHSNSLTIAYFYIFHTLHVLLVVCSNHVSILYCFWDIQCRIMAWGSPALHTYGRPIHRWHLQTRDHRFTSDSMCLFSFRSTQRAEETSYSVRRCVTAVQGRRNWYQSKARATSYQSCIVTFKAYFLSLQRYNDLLVENLRYFSPFYQPVTRLKGWGGGSP